MLPVDSHIIHVYLDRSSGCIFGWDRSSYSMGSCYENKADPEEINDKDLTAIEIIGDQTIHCTSMFYCLATLRNEIVTIPDHLWLRSDL